MHDRPATFRPLDKKRETHDDLPNGGASYVARKTKISNGDLTALFYERIREDPGCPPGINLAIVPVAPSGWTALTTSRPRTKNPLCAERFEAVLAELRKTYDLAKD
jgi:hypothetical protein